MCCASSIFGFVASFSISPSRNENHVREAMRTFRCIVHSPFILPYLGTIGFGAADAWFRAGGTSLKDRFIGFTDSHVCPLRAP